MPRTIRTIDEFQKYLSGVRERAQHHAETVDSVIFSLAGVVVMLKDDGTDLEVREHGENFANVLWMYRNKRRFAFSYEHVTGQIEVREDSIRGRVLYRFNDETPHDEVYKALSEL